MIKLKKPNIKEIVPKVFVVTMDNQFDLAMTFCYFQEYYESPDMKGKQFTFAEFMRYYAHKWGKPKGSFSYTEDWNGFNIPGNILRNCFVDNFTFNDKGFHECAYMNEYQEYMVTKILRPITLKNKGWDFYLIGVHSCNDKNEREALIAHEVAHGLYFTNNEYRKEIDQLLKQTPKKVLQYMKRKLKAVGYADHVIKDETQAHLATGIRKNMDPKRLKPEMKSFLKTLKKYYSKAKRDDSKFEG